jgi:hypothetical protein
MRGWTARIGRLLAVPATAALALYGSLITAAAVPLLQISDDPYTNVTSQHKTEVEPDTFAFGSTIVSTFQVGRFFDGGASNIGWATSTDGGTTWTSGFLPGITVYQGGTFDRASDPAVAYDAAHNVWMISSLGIVAPPVRATTLLISRSLDGGLTWEAPVAAHVAANIDKNWTVCDITASSPYYGSCYSEWDDVSTGNVIKMNTSTDGGVTWGPPMNTADVASGLGGQPVVQPSGTVVVPYSGNFGSVRSFVSTDGGASWSASVLVSAVMHHNTVGLRSPPLPTAEVDADGGVWVAWADCRFRVGCGGNDIVLSESADGLTWSDPTRVPIDDVDSGADYFIPGLGVDPTQPSVTAHLGLAFYFYPVSSCSVATCQLYAGYISSIDAATTWSAPVQLTDTAMSLSWLANTNQGRMVGDYISTSWIAGGTAHPVIAVANAPGVSFDEAMYTPVTGLLGAGRGPVRSAGGDRRVYFGIGEIAPGGPLPTLR